MNRSEEMRQDRKIKFNKAKQG